MRLTTMQCSICGDEMEYEIVELELVSRQTANQPGWYCWTCNVGNHTAQDLFLAEHHAGEHEPKKPSKR
jgi:hypothetical protein